MTVDQISDIPISDLQPKGRGKSATSTEDAAGLRDGYSVSQYAFALRLDPRTVAARLAGVQAAGTRNGSPIFRLADALSALATPTEDQIRESILRMTARELPRGLSAAFWRGEGARLDVAERKSQLWDTAIVLKAMGRLIGGLDMALKLLPDEIERAGELSDRQRVALNNAVRSARNTMAAVLAEVSATVPNGRADAQEQGEADDKEI